ncbi:GTP pyrophosphokinase [Paenibacillus sp. USHLN196]|uniref:GTP pyrophosphokinase n=1 Tax=Paenibacillus sp. USHLN196 TaxID=3081291 RepID=UPI003017A535
MSNLNLAIKIAAEAHVGQIDKAGDPYILHPLRVMMQFDTEAERIVGVLHDVLEDTYIKEKDLLDLGFTEEIVEAIKSVTRNRLSPGRMENYWDFIRRARLNPIGVKVKLADVKDNMDWSRIPNPKEEDMKRMQKYQQAYLMLIEYIK